MPSVVAEIPEYNNAIVNMLRSDGDKSTPAVLFSFNHAFDREVVTKAEACRTAGKAGRVTRAKAQLKHLDDTLAQYGIDKDRVVYLESATGSKYCAESAEIYKLFLKKYKSRLNHMDTVMIRDAGRSFTPGGVSVFSTMTPILGRAVVMPPMLHHFHSPCDNRVTMVRPRPSGGPFQATQTTWYPVCSCSMSWMSSVQLISRGGLTETFVMLRTKSQKTS